MLRFLHLPIAFLALLLPTALRAADFFPFNPKPDTFTDAAALDLRFLNEKLAGEGGFIAVKDGQFIHSKTGQPVRFWAVNGPSGEAKDLPTLRSIARTLAKRGVNLVRVHSGGFFDESGNADPAKIKHAQDIVQAMKEQGIYTHISIYFPLWLKPKPNTPWAQGYDGKTVAFSTLYFNPDFQKQYQSWWKALLTTPTADGKQLLDDPAVASVEIINEDSFFFWTFKPADFPAPQRQLIESQFAAWLTTKYGSLDKALAKWGSSWQKDDAPASNRIAFRGLWNIFNDRTNRDKDTAQFLFETQRAFYADTVKFLHTLGFKGCITASNWTTASSQYFGPLEEMSYLPGDFIDRHGYFDCDLKGQDSGWSIRDGYTYIDRSALRFDGADPAKPAVKSFSNPVADMHYNGKPSMISETTFCRPNRYRSEAPLFYACYGALQDSNCIVHFALDSETWAVKPRFFMQPWTILTPAMAGQFPAAALIFRQGLVDPGKQLVELNLRPADMLELAGTPLPREANLDELRAKDVPPAAMNAKSNPAIDSLVFFAGRTSTTFTDTPAPSKIADLTPYIDRAHSLVTASNGQLKLDYAKGLLTINAPKAQGISGNLAAAGATTLANITITSDMALGHIIAVPLDNQPLATSARILLQVMSEEQATGFATTPAAGVNRITSIGHDPWLVKNLTGTVRFTRPDAATLKVTRLDFNGYPIVIPPDAPPTMAAQFALHPETIYYLITK